MADTKPIPVRLPEDLIARLDRAGNRIGSNRSAIIRFCTETWLNHFEKQGFASLPPDWDEILANMDGRTTGSRDIYESGGFKMNDKASSPASSKPASVSTALLKSAVDSTLNETQGPGPSHGVGATTEKTSPPKSGNEQR